MTGDGAGPPDGRPGPVVLYRVPGSGSLHVTLCAYLRFAKRLRLNGRLW